MHVFRQSPTDPAFVQNPYPAYAAARNAGGALVWWHDYDMPAALSHGLVHSLLRDRRFSRVAPPEHSPPRPPHLLPFYAVEDHSLLEIEPPRHTRLRGLVQRAFTPVRIAALAPSVEHLCHDLIDNFPQTRFDLLPAYCQRVPVIVIARLLGLPDSDAPDLLRWSGSMVAMYQARRTRQTENAAARAATEFTAFLRRRIADRQRAPGDDLLSHLIAAQADGDRLSQAEMISTCILLLNAGHEATVHALGNGVRLLLAHGPADPETPGLPEEILRADPPLHIFTRYATETAEIAGHRFIRGDRVALVLGAANHDPAIWPDPARFNPARPVHPHLALGGGPHFCLGAALARLELRIALATLMRRCPGLRADGPARYADTYHFHGLETLPVRL
ncbi:MAG: cytochrome P450 [Rhodobacteraceae bacterium]|nr:cytochrome P450 [Paracoccaceae bacterium]